MASWTAATAIPSGSLITSAWISNVTSAINFLGAASATAGKDLAYLRRTTTQSLVTSAFTPVNFDAEDIDVANGHSITTNTSRYTAVAAGKYRLTGNVGLTYAAAGAYAMAGIFRKNGTGTGLTGQITGSYVYNYTSSSTSIHSLIMPTTYVSLAVGDYVELCVSNGGGTPLVDPTYGCAFGIEWVGA